MKNARRRSALVLAGLFAFLALTASSCEHKPKGRFIDRVKTVCGPEIARRYENIPWVDRDYAADSILISCVLFPEETIGRDRTIEADQARG